MTSVSRLARLYLRRRRGISDSGRGLETYLLWELAEQCSGGKYPSAADGLP
jgi:hypothetical protein